MKSYSNYIQLLILFTMLIVFKLGNGQIMVESGAAVTPVDLVETILGEGLQYSNVQYQGADSAKGIFYNGQTTNLGIEKGIVLTSGRADSIVGPNNNSNTGTQNFTEGYPLLESIATSTTYDACVLEFDFIPEFDTLRFKYVFGSEEYNEYIGSVFNDVFGLFISGPNPDGGIYEDKNIAIVPGTVNSNIVVNNINNGWATPSEVPTGPCTNCEYYNDNTFGLTLEYDGFTTVLVAWLKVIPNEQYHAVIGVADVGDLLWDTGIFLEENCIEANFPRITTEINLQPPGIMDSMVEEFITAEITFKLINPDVFPITFDLELGGNANPNPYDPDGGDFEEAVPMEVTFEEGEDSVVYQIKAVFDGILEGDEYLDLVIINPYASSPIYDTVTLPILDYVEMYTPTSPNTMICTAQELDLWVQVYNGFPPYSLFWEPGGYTTDSILVSPDTTTTYYITISDMFTNIMDSILVTVIPHAEIFSFSFETENNPMLFADVIGEVFEDSISLDVPFGTSLENLVATYELQEGAWIYANDVLQTNGVTENDFNNPIIYRVIAPWGCMEEWVVYVNLVTGLPEVSLNNISVFPNPANEKIYINAAHGYTLTIINNLGVELLQEKIISSDFTVDVNNFEEGLYFLQFRNDQKWFVEKVIVIR